MLSTGLPGLGYPGHLSLETASTLGSFECGLLTEAAPVGFDSAE